MVSQASNAQALSNDRVVRAFPLPGTTLYDVTFKPEFRQEFHSKLKPTNRLLVPLYKAQVLSLFGLSQRIMLLTTRGRNSQRRRDFPIGYFRIGVVQDPQELKRIIHQLIRDDPEGAHTLMGWDPSRDDVESADFSLMIEKVLTLRFPADIAGQATPLVQGIDLGMVVPNRANGCRSVAEVVDRRL